MSKLDTLKGKACPDIAALTVLTAKGPGVKLSLKKFLADKPKTVVLCVRRYAKRARTKHAKLTFLRG